MKVRILGSVNHNGRELEQYEVYDLSDKSAQDLINAGVAEQVDEKKTAQPEPDPKPRDPKDPNAPYVAEAPVDKSKLTEEQLKQVEEDKTPVVEPTKEKDPEEVVVVEGEKAQDSTPGSGETPPDDTGIGKSE